MHTAHMFHALDDHEETNCRCADGDQVKLQAEWILTTSHLNFFNPEKLFTLNVRDVQFG